MNQPARAVGQPGWLFMDSGMAGWNPGALGLRLEIELPAALKRFDDEVGRFVGRGLPPPPARAFQKFSGLEERARAAILKGILAQSEFAVSAMAEGISALNERAMLEFARGRLGLLSDNSLASLVCDGDVVEIFDRSHIQVYRSYSCFSLCNYSLLELAAYPWFELYERSSVITNLFLGRMAGIFGGKASFISYDDLPEYTLRELMTEERAVFGVREKFMAKMRSALTGEPYILSVKTVRKFPSGREFGSVSFL